MPKWQVLGGGLQPYALVKFLCGFFVFSLHGLGFRVYYQHERKPETVRSL